MQRRGKKTYQRSKATEEKRSSELLNEGVQKMAEEAMKVHEEILLANDLDETLCLHHIARDTRKAIRVDLLRRQEGGDGCDVAEVGCACRGKGSFLVA